MKGCLIRAGAALVGLVVGVIYLIWMIDVGLIELGFNWGPSQGAGWILLVIIVAPTIGVLLVDGRERLASVLLLLIVLALPMVVAFTARM
jgi:hypothetical protein